MGNFIPPVEDNDEEQPAMQQKSDPAGTRPTASKPWVELNDPGNVMMTLGRRRVEWSVRMGVIYCVTMLYAVSEHVSNSRVFGTWPILANFYGTFAIASSVGGAVTGCVEMARGCTLGTLLAVATVEITVAACVEIKILRRVRAESSRRPPRHRRDACSMAWRCQFLAARPSQHCRVITEK